MTFEKLDMSEQRRLEDKYGALRGDYMRVFKCQQEQRYDTKTAIIRMAAVPDGSDGHVHWSKQSIWTEGDPKFINVKDGQFVSVEY